MNNDFTKTFAQYIENITRVVISFEIYQTSPQMTTSVIFCLSYDISKELIIVTCSRESDNTRVVITLFMTRRYPLNNSDVRTEQNLQDSLVVKYNVTKC